MEKELADRFFNNVKWFNSFFADLKTLFDKISSQIDGYDHKLYYYFKPKDKPEIPTAYFLFLGGEGPYNLNLLFIFNREYATNKFIAIAEPSILIVLHNYDRYETPWITWNILEGKNIEEIDENNGLISGIINWGETYPPINFYSFLVPLDAFSEYKDQTVKDLIVTRIDNIVPQIE